MSTRPGIDPKQSHRREIGDTQYANHNIAVDNNLLAWTAEASGPRGPQLSPTCPVLSPCSTVKTLNVTLVHQLTCKKQHIIQHNTVTVGNAEYIP